MTRVLLTTSVIALGLGVQAQSVSFVERLETALAQQGYTDIEIAVVDGKLKIDGKKDGQAMETVYLSAAPKVVRRELEEEDA